MSHHTAFSNSPRIIAVERLTIKERLSRLFIPNRDTVPILFSEENLDRTPSAGGSRRGRSYHPQSTATPALVHCHSMFSVRTAMSSLAELTDDNGSDISSVDDDEDDDDEYQPQQQVAYSVSIPLASIAAAQAARSKRLQARAARMVPRHPLA